MATKTANVMARVEPSVKEQAEDIMEMLGIPVSVVINTLYKQIIMTRSIPFSLSLPAAPSTRDEMDSSAFDAMMERGMKEAKMDASRDAADVFCRFETGDTINAVKVCGKAHIPGSGTACGNNKVYS